MRQSRRREQAARGPAPCGPRKEPGTRPLPAVPGRWYFHAAAFLLMAAAVFLLYRGTLDLGFLNLDDSNYVENNPWIRKLSGANLRHILTEPYFANYSPLHIFSYAVDYAIGGLEPRFFHFSNLLWAGLVAGFVYLVAVALTGRRSVGLAAGALFVVHPVHVEVVAWISSRKDLVSAAFALPSVLAWLEYRKRGKGSKAWYALSLVFFTLAIAGKLSVVLLPAILLAVDYFVETRRGPGLFLDKIPFVLVAALFSLPTMGAQPLTGYSLDLPVVGHSLLRSARLLSGFGEHVLVWPRATDLSGVGAFVLACLPFAVLVLPFLSRRFLPGLAVALLYWIALSLVPSQVMSFVHPVAERYLYFPSVGLVILTAWAVPHAFRRLRRGGAAAVLLLAGLGAAWSYNTIDYLKEWTDPRSVWYAATAKSEDPNVYLYLGSYYQDVADSIPKRLKAGGRPEEVLRRLAGLEWAGDSRLAPLLGEWMEKGPPGPVTAAFQKHLWEAAWKQYDLALAHKGTRILQNLYFRRGMILGNMNDWKSARTEFERAYDESRRFTFKETRDEMAIRCHYAMGVAEWRLKHYDDAEKMLTLAKQEQDVFGIPIQPGLDDYLQRLRRLTGEK